MQVRIYIRAAMNTDEKPIRVQRRMRRLLRRSTLGGKVAGTPGSIAAAETVLASDEVY